ncbi:UNVERIFIED_ORG: putative transcriptional regulator [Methylorubrum zatmanii]
MGERFAGAWRRAEAGNLTPARPVVTFETWGAFLATFSDARVALLKRLAEDGPAPSINALAGSLGRPYRRVHDDVSALMAAGLIGREGTRIELAAEGAQAHISFKALSAS